MTFDEFARAHGLIIRHVIADGHVHRVPTETKPRKKNGAYAFNGAHGFVQDWTVHPEAIPFRVDHAEEMSATVRPVIDDSRARAKAASKAGEMARAIIQRSIYGQHPYLTRKGLRDVLGLVDPTDGKLIVPMHNAHFYGRVISVQRIGEDGEKKFLPGSKAKNAVFMIGRGRRDLLVEGYATGHSILAALARMYEKARVIVCFSAGNIVSVAPLFPKGIVVADNDESGTGEAAAEKSGLQVVRLPLKGDANDLHQSLGIETLCRLLRSA